MLGRYPFGDGRDVGDGGGDSLVAAAAATI